MQPPDLELAGCARHEWRYGGSDGLTSDDGLVIGCEAPYRLICIVCGVVRLGRCGKSSTRRCAPCGNRSRARVGHVGRSGLVVSTEGLFVTLTAPSWRPHFLPDGRACRCTGSGRSRRPSADLAEWNASSGARWHRLMQDLRRLLGEDVQYFKGAEVQRRGALHFHVLLRDPAGRPLLLSTGQLRALAIKHGFGHSVDVQRLEVGHATYAAKYASKASSERPDVPWRGYARCERVDKSTGEVRKSKRWVTVATYRTWTCSRAWGRSMASIRAAQSHHEATLEALPHWSRLQPFPELAVLCPVPRRPPI